MIKTWKLGEPIKMSSSRFAVNDKLFELARENNDVVLVTCDNSAHGSPQEAFSVEFGNRFIDCGIAEQNAVGIAAGLALCGKRVYCQSFACFLSLRALEFIYLDAAYNNAPIVFLATHSGVTSPTSGTTHTALIDLACMRAMPNMTVIVPSDPVISKKAIEKSIEFKGPIYIRLGKGMEPKVYKEDIAGFEIGKGILIRNGMDITIIGCGSTVFHCLRAAQMLEEKGIDARVIDMHTIKPLDTDIIISAAKETQGIITCEDHFVTGGLGSAVSEVVASYIGNGKQTIVKRLGIPDCFPIQGEKPEQIYSYYMFDSDGIAKKAIELINSIK